MSWAQIGPARVDLLHFHLLVLVGAMT